MEIASNRIKDIAAYFREKLDMYYEPSEIEEFIVMCIGHYVGIKRYEFSIHQEERVNQSDLLKFHFVVKQLKQHRPIQYILGEAWFYGMRLRVNEHVLIPRPETEELVEWIEDDYKNKKAVDVLDLCTGSGCIALGLSKALNDVKITAIDVSKEALQVASENAKQYNFHIDFIADDALKLNPSNYGTYDIVVSNPPYVRKAEACTMKQNVLEHEPHLALFVADDNALVFYEAIAEFARQKLKPEGALYFEINQDLANETASLLLRIGFKNVELRKDMQGNDRMIRAFLR